MNLKRCKLFHRAEQTAGPLLPLFFHSNKQYTMYKKGNYSSPRNTFAAFELTGEPGFLDVFNRNTNLRVARLNAEDATFSFVDPDGHLSTGQLQDLIDMAKALQPSFQPVDNETDD